MKKVFMKKIMNPWLGLDGYMCFGCSPENPSGLKMEFYEDGDDVVAFWKPEAKYQGWLNTLHGGIQSTLMDEIAAWVIARKLQTVGVTSRMEVKYKKSIYTTEPQVTLRCRITEQKRNVVFVDVELFNSHDELCSSAHVVYFTVNKEKAVEEFYFNGCETE